MDPCAAVAGVWFVKVSLHQLSNFPDRQMLQYVVKYSHRFDDRVIMAALRNTAIGLMRWNGETNVKDFEATGSAGLDQASLEFAHGTMEWKRHHEVWVVLQERTRHCGVTVLLDDEVAAASSAPLQRDPTLSSPHSCLIEQ